MVSKGENITRTSVQPEEDLSLKDILEIEVPDERVNRLKKLTHPDDELSDEVETWVARKQVQWANIQYARFLAGAKYTEQDVDDVLTNSIDIHAHGGSDPFERLMLEDDLAYDYTDAGMRAMVVKTWYTPSASRNALVQKLVDRYAEERNLRAVQCFGGVTLNYSQGGLNPEAVKKCLGFPGMKYVWMPMVDSYHHRKVVYDDTSGHGIELLDERGRVVPELREIIKIAAENDLVLACGHYPFEDTYRLFQEAKDAGVIHMEVVHPAHIHSKHSIKQMQMQAELGVKLMLSGLGAEAFPLHESGPLYAARQIKEVGAENCVYGSDYGQLQNFPHVVGTRWMIKLLFSYGCTKEELYKVFQVSPAAHLGIEPPPPLGVPAHPNWPKHSSFSKYAGHPQGDPQARERSHGRWTPPLNGNNG
ncbi:MAG: hypothetical protein EPN30_04205 [Actinomycetota bacterium]|nr:MAG: hypothetical protein EPN30_04205 [Actinomycetota bacterium]